MLKVATALALGLACASAQVPSVPQSHSRHDATVVRLDNGDTKTATGPTYDDLPNNRTRYEMIEQPGLVVIELYKLGKEFGLQGDQCQWCPLSFTQYPFGPSSESSSLGQLKVDDVLCNGFQANTSYGSQVMRTDNWWMAVADDVPVQQFSIFTPFGHYAGNGTMDITNFKPGPQPDDLFAIPDIDKCTRSPNCDSITDVSIISMLPRNMRSSFMPFRRMIASALGLNRKNIRGGVATA